MTLDQHIGERLRYARRAAGFDASAAAHNLDLSELELKQYETGSLRIPSNFVSRAAKLFDVEIRWFFETGFETDRDQKNTSDAGSQILQSLRSNKTLSRLCEAMRESDYMSKSQKFVA